MALYNNGTLVSGANTLPQLTLAQYNALANKPKYWIRTDANYTSIPATDVSFDDTTAQLGATDVQGAIDALNTDLTPISQSNIAVLSGLTTNTLTCYVIGKICIVAGNFSIQNSISITTATTILSNLPQAKVRDNNPFIISIHNGGTYTARCYGNAIYSNQTYSLSSGTDFYVHGVYVIA